MVKNRESFIVFPLRNLPYTEFYTLQRATLYGCSSVWAMMARKVMSP